MLQCVLDDESFGRVPCPRAETARDAAVIENATHMGSTRQSALPACGELAPPDFSQEIGAAPRHLVATACQVVPSSGGVDDLVFGEEVPIRVLWDAKQERLSDGRGVRWWRLEAKVDQTRASGVRPRDYLVVAEHPYSIQRVHSALFKPASKKSREERPSFAHSCSSTEELLERIEALGVDYWERGSFLTAGLSNPNTLMRPGEASRQYQHTQFVFGVCGDLEQCLQKLLACEQVQRLLRQTRERTLRFWPKTAKLTETPRLYDEVAERGPEIMFLSIRQAMAGPTEPGWSGRPVVALVDRIYRAHLNNLNRAVARGRP